MLSWASEASSLSAATVLKAYTSSAADGNTRFSFKYAALRSVYGTPTFLVNQVMTDLSADSTVGDWAKQLDPLLAATAREGAAVVEGKAEVVRAGGVRA